VRNLTLFLILVFLAVSANATEKYIYERFEHHKEIKVLLKNVSNEVSGPIVNTDVFSEGFKAALKAREAIKFAPVENEAEADVIITAVIKDFDFVKEAMPMPANSVGFIADIATPKSSARLTVDYQLIDAKSGKVLGNYNNFATDYRTPRKDTTEETAYKYAAEDNADKFIVKAFYAPRHK